MSVLPGLIREIKFTARDRSVWLWLLIVLSLSVISITFGLLEVDRQQTSIETLINADQEDRSLVSKKLKDWGSAAYYSFHLTYDPPSDFAYAALGLRDSQPWKHRIRMLALEGQIYESDAGNPSIALIGRFDYAFFTAFIIPLIIIMLLYDLRTSEKTAGRYDLLEATVGHSVSFWLVRSALRALAMFICLIVPLNFAGILAETAASKLLLASIWIFAYVVFWMLICFIVGAWQKSDSVILMSLLSIWILTAVIVPASARLIIDRSVSIPSGSEILLRQRETVNDAWDLPREVTMDAFFERHPAWVDYQPIESSFEWQWYYAFQQVGDQETEALSTAYREGRLERDRMAAWASVFAPPSLLERALQSLAKTDLKSSIDYEQQIRAYHSDLRNFYYPRFFTNAAFDKSQLKNRPLFKPNS